MELAQRYVLHVREGDEGKFPWLPLGRCPRHQPTDSSFQGAAGTLPPGHLYGQR